MQFGQYLFSCKRLIGVMLKIFGFIQVFKRDKECCFYKRQQHIQVSRARFFNSIHGSLKLPLEALQLFNYQIQFLFLVPENTLFVIKGEQHYPYYAYAIN